MRIDLDLPLGCIIKGFLPSSKEVEWLVGDMIEIDLPDGTIISVGWIPEHDINGRYQLVQFRDYWDNQETEFYSKDLEEVIKIIYKITSKFNI